MLKNAPHTADVLLAAEWTRPYPRDKAAFPLPWVRANKYWPPVGRINNTFGDRNFVCACPPLSCLPARCPAPICASPRRRSTARWLETQAALPRGFRVGTSRFAFTPARGAQARRA